MKEILESVWKAIKVFSVIILTSVVITCFGMFGIGGFVVWLFGVSDPYLEFNLRMVSFVLFVAFCALIKVEYDSNKLDKK